MKSANIVSITDIIENKVRKQKELEGAKSADQPKAAKKSCGCC